MSSASASAAAAATAADETTTRLGHLKKWVKNHKKTVIFVSAAGVCTYYLVQRYYAVRLEREKHEARLMEQQRLAEDHAHAQLEDHFESIQRIADSTTLPGPLMHLKNRLSDRVDLQVLTEKLMTAKTAPETLSSSDKKQIWGDIKILSFTRALSAMYSLSLLDLLLRTQLNILGRRVYFDTAGFPGSYPNGRGMMRSYKPLSMGAQHRFMAFTDFLSHEGLESLVVNIQAAVEQVIKNKPLKEPFTHEGLRDLLMRMRFVFERNQSDWVRYLLPNNGRLPENLAAASSAVVMRDGAYGDGEASDDDERMLKQLLNETRIVLLSQEFNSVLRVVLDTLLEQMMEDMLDTFGENQDVGIPMAKLLPPIASIATALLESPEQNVFVKNLSVLQPVHAFCAMVYSSAGTVS